MTDFLLELRSEEIPARMQDKARDDLARLFAAELDKAGLRAGELVTYATPRRLALIARDLPAQTQAVSEELKGPPADAPDAAIDGFLRKAGLTRDALETREVKGRATLFAVIDKPGRATAQVLAEAIPGLVRAFPWPKSMRWGDASLSTESLRWVRPLQGIVALFGDDVVACEVAGVASGAATVGHRFHHPGVITIGSASDYVEKLRACHVVVDQAERRATIALGAKMAANKAGLTLVEDEALVTENAGLTEWPVPLLGSFDPVLLDAPQEVLELTLKVNQKYFSLRQANGEQAPNFVCVANIDAADGGEKIVEGNRKVAAARLSDAIFFYEQDLKVPLEEQAKKLDRIVFHEKLGTVADKAQRVADLAHWLIAEGIVPVPDADRKLFASYAYRAGKLAKADLVTQTVGEFPEVQGIIGYELAMSEDQPIEIARAIRDHYKPVGQGDDIPTEPVSVAVSLADKLDTIFSFFAVSQMPTGSKDPFALRRAALGVVTLAQVNQIRLPLRRAFDANHAHWLVALARYWADQCNVPLPEFEVAISDFDEFRAKVQETLHFQVDQNWADQFWQNSAVRKPDMWSAVLDFFADRLKVQQREAGVRHDLIDAVFALGGEDDLVRLLARVHALQTFMATDDGANLLAGYKRAANILKKEGWAASPLPVGEGGAPSGAGGEGSTLDPHPSDASRLPPSPNGRGNYAPEPAEAALIAALDDAEPRAATAVEGERFEAAMAALATLRAPIDAFFTDVTVNDADPAKRESRLALLARMRDAVHRVADFGKIEG